MHASHLASLVGPLLLAATALPTTNEPPRDAARHPRAREVVRIVRQHSAGTTTGEAPPGMVLLPSGSYRMGAPMADALALAAGDNARWAGEIVAMAPDHLVLVDSLFLDRFEVTNGQFERWRKAAGIERANPVVGDHDRNGVPPTAPAALPPDPRLPVRDVDWNEARACARWLGKRLPSEAEWEFAARRERPDHCFYPWGEGWKAWDPSRCADYDSATRKVGPPQLFVGGSFKDDVSVDGLFDLCGNVAEWTSSRFQPYPGFVAPVVKDRFGSRVATPQFGSELRAIRGGSSYGNAVSNNLVYRMGQSPTTRVEGVGFRCAASFTPGLDALRDAIEELVTAASGLRDAVDLGDSSLAAQFVHFGDAQTGLSDSVNGAAFTHVKPLHGLFVNLRADSLYHPMLVGVLTLAQPSLDPPLPAGSYAVRFKTHGRTKEQQKQIDDLRRHKHPAPTVGKPDHAAEESPLTGILTVPPDVDALIFENRRAEFCGFVPAHLSDSALYATRINVARTEVAASGTAKSEKVERDEVKFTFGVKTDNGGLQPQFELALAFASGTFEPTGK
jgi:formylglycine-generating enzyme required for sulfatase activity